MSQDSFPYRVTQPATEAHVVRFVGGTTAVTKVLGLGLATTYISTGVVDLVWSENPGLYLGLVGAPSFDATTPANVKTYVGIPGTWNSTTFTLRLSMYEGGTLTDLAALEWCSLTPLFKKTSV